MSTILNYSLMLNLQFPHANETESAIVEYMKDLHNFNAAIVTDDPIFWNDVHLPFPVLRSKLTPLQSLYMAMYVYILDLRNFEGIIINHLKLLQRNANTKFVAVVNENKNEIIEEMTKFGLCNILIISMNKTYFEDEIVYDPCRGIGGRPKDTDTECKENASVMSFPPATFYESPKAISGYEGLMFRTSCESYGLSMNYINRSEKIGQANPPAFGTLGDVVTGRSMAGFGVLYSLKIRYDYMDGIQMCADADFSWAVHSRAGKTHPTWFIVLVTEFSSTVWIWLLITYIMLVCSYFLSHNAKLSMWPFDILALIIGYPLEFENNKVFKILVIIFGFTVTAHYKTMMSSKLTVPTPIPEIDTNKELSETGLRLKGAPSLGFIFKGISEGNPDDPVSADIAARYENSMVELKYHLLRIAEKRDIAVTRSSDNIYYIAQKVGIAFLKFLNSNYKKTKDRLRNVEILAVGLLIEQRG